MQYILTCKSLTYAQRVAKVLERAGITGTVSKVPGELSTNGCSYCVKVSARVYQSAYIVMTDAGLSPEGIYRMEDDGYLEEVAMWAI